MNGQKQTGKYVKAVKILKYFGCYLLLGIGTVLFVILLRIFLIASFKIPSASMEPTILPGDFILVNKLIPGPRILTSLNLKDGVKTKRLKGYRPIRRNDILVFNFPYAGSWDKIKMNLGQYYVKRCVAIPGDTFYIQNGFYKVAGCSETLGSYANQAALSELKEEELQKIGGIYHTFPYDTIRYSWNIKNFGPLYIPRQNDLLPVDSATIRLYKNLIEYETKKEITFAGGTVLLDGKQIDRYLFRQNYYFMCGDWVPDSRDSRYWGLLPEDHIIGKAFLIWKSWDPDSGKFRFNRFFKTMK
ncbi:signal peptidase I [Parabacteroides sp. Marseille-P3160]|uniref:signal peptidase I n=1 Tax=Parabacteroides sp. Marseille-P3160 TaxID=1917887 RepID=UPI0009B98B1E|nr:signal peptidase I [Parabacteroides sp. Marseille-P3160]